MHKDLVSEPQSSFLSCEKDTELIWRRLFVENKTVGDMLKRLLVIETEDCIDKKSELNAFYQNKIDKMSLIQLKKDGYLKIVPKMKNKEHEEIKSYIIISFDNFTMNETNPEFRDCTINFDIVCHTDYWDIGDYRIRPLKIAGYIDSMLNETHLTGIGRLHFLGCSEFLFDEYLSGYTLAYRAVHGSDDIIPFEEE